MKKHTYIIATVITVLLLGLIAFQYNRNHELKRQYDIAIQNNKAYESQFDVIQEENRVFQFTIEQLEVLND